MFGSSLLVLSLAALGLAADPKPPALTFLYAINLTIPNAATVQIGNTPTGARGLLSITGGSFWGPKLNGKVGVGLDWGLTDSKGTFSPEAVYVLQTNDSANILVTERGHAPNVLLTFDTGHPKYSWLNTAVGYASGAPFDNGVALEVWQIGS